MYNHYFTYRSSLNVGVQAHLDYYRETLGNDTPWLGSDRAYDFGRDEEEVGAYAEYTYAVRDKFSVVAGLRGDYNAFYDRFFLTPRGHVKWNVTPSTTLRASAGLGYRSTNVITDNIGMLATGRELVIPALGDLDRLEKALTLAAAHADLRTGESGRRDAELRLLPHAVLQLGGGRSGVRCADDPGLRQRRTVVHRHLPDRLLVDARRAARHFRHVPLHGQPHDDRPSGRHDGLVERPAGERVQDAAQYPVRHEVPPRWVFDATPQLNGPARIPTQTGDLADSRYSPRYPMFYAQVSRKVGKFDIYGCENIADVGRRT